MKIQILIIALCLGVALCKRGGHKKNHHRDGGNSNAGAGVADTGASSAPAAAANTPYSYSSYDSYDYSSSSDGYNGYYGWYDYVSYNVSFIVDPLLFSTNLAPYLTPLSTFLTAAGVSVTSAPSGTNITLTHVSSYLVDDYISQIPTNGNSGATIVTAPATGDVPRTAKQTIIYFRGTKRVTIVKMPNDDLKKFLQDIDYELHYRITSIADGILTRWLSDAPL